MTVYTNRGGVTQIFETSTLLQLAVTVERPFDEVDDTICVTCFTDVPPESYTFITYIF